MKTPPGRRIIQTHDASGFPAIQWEVMPAAQRKLVGWVLAGVAAGSGFAGREFPGEFWGLVREARGGPPDWLGLAVTGMMALGTVAAVLAFGGLAFLTLFRSRPERFVFAGSRLLYEPGSALLGLGTGAPSELSVLWDMARGRGVLELSKDRFSEASVGSYRGRTHVLLQAGDRQWRAGMFLDRKEQHWLVETLGEWKRRG